jgi:large conductance mechanosensitive channel
MKKFINEFKDFIAGGDLITTAVALVIALKIKDVIDSFMNGVVNPLIAGIFGKQNFDDVLSFHVGNAAHEVANVDATKPPTIEHGSLVKPGVLITSFINLVIVGLVLFMIIKAYNNYKAKKAGPAEAAGPSELDVLTQIRDELRQRTS